MKKLISLVLTLALLCCMTTAFAATTVVGADGGALESEFTDATDGTGHQVDITVSVSNVVHKYAVDVEYDSTALTLGGATLTWDVDTMKYEVSGGDDSTDAKTKSITIINRSDLPVDAYATIADAKADDFLGITSDYTDGNPLPVDAATAGTDSANGTASTGTITISVAPETGKTWGDVKTFYANTSVEKTFTVATATVYIAPKSAATT